MARSHADGDLIPAIYDAAIDPSGWDEVVNRRKAQNHRGDGAQPHEPHSGEDRNHPPDGAHPPVF